MLSVCPPQHIRNCTTYLQVPHFYCSCCPYHRTSYFYSQDSTLLTSHSLTERVKLWDKFTVPVDQDAIRLKFFQRVHRKNPPFRYKVRRALRSRIRVSTCCLGTADIFETELIDLQVSTKEYAFFLFFLFIPVVIYYLYIEREI